MYKRSDSPYMPYNKKRGVGGRTFLLASNVQKRILLDLPEPAGNTIYTAFLSVDIEIGRDGFFRLNTKDLDAIDPDSLT